MDPADVISVYDNIRRLYAAAWMICQRNRSTPFLKDVKTVQPVPVAVPAAPEKPAANTVEIVPVKSETKTWAEGLGLQEVSRFIVKAMPTVKLIVHIHTHREPFTYYLLLLVSSGEALQEHEIANKIEDKLKPMASVFIFAHKLSGLKKALQSERRFFIDALTTKTIVYQAEDFEMPELPTLSAEQIKAKAQLDFNKFNVQAQDFLRGARYYKELKNYNLAAFNLNQAVESIFIALIRAVLGYKISVHNLSRMLRISMIFTNQIKEVLQLETIEGSKLFETLRSAYSHSRYVSSYEVDEKTVEKLDELAVSVLSVAQEVYDTLK
ncbi:HEPN domain-containing protein [Mucilaginibacter pedocola]|uniref:HEPN domain-containing protein n=1 Tax=Mucilaginibacter pedocola TaxID=1792845 RepID=A0A1S9PHD8_9SPHI|nr:HEPN domain-containing protein [Mucilaginibacter pedocola]OOQ60377.1 hypothetical protein BC343_25490 [Mucilaginibacter pedocola]